MTTEAITSTVPAPPEPDAVRIYVAGPMTGLPDYNYPAFRSAANRLRRAGFDVEDPSQNPGCSHFRWQDYMRASLPQLLRCQGVALLPGWEVSKGANIEHDLAVALGMDVRSLEAWVLRGDLRRLAAEVQA